MHARRSARIQSDASPRRQLRLRFQIRQASREAPGLHAVSLSVNPIAFRTYFSFGFGSRTSAGGGTRTPDTRIMIPLL